MKKTNLMTLATALFFALSLIACTNGNYNSSSPDSTGGDSMKKSGQMSSDPSTGGLGDTAVAGGADAKLVYELVESMNGGIALMEQAETKATTPGVKALAKKLDTEHSALTNDLKELATKKGWALPAGESEKDMKKRDDLGKEEVAEYEKDWLEALKDRHETNIKKLEDAKPTDADLKAAGEKGLPKLKALLADIKAQQEKLKK